jgi:hypothetical protein
VHRRSVEQPEHGELEYPGAVASHAFPQKVVVSRYVAVRCLVAILRIVRSNR